LERFRLRIRMVTKKKDSYIEGEERRHAFPFPDISDYIKKDGKGNKRLKTKNKKRCK